MTLEPLAPVGCPKVASKVSLVMLVGRQHPGLHRRTWAFVQTNFGTPRKS